MSRRRGWDRVRGFAVAATMVVGSLPAMASAGPSEDAAASAAILPISVDGEMSDADRAALTAQLVEGLQRGSFGIVSPEQAGAAAGNAEKCDKPRCFKKVATDTNATHVVRAEVTVQDRDYAVKVVLADGGDGAVIATSEDSCEICGVNDVGQMLSSSAATLRTKLDALASGPSTLLVSSNPAGATVTMDGEIIGVTPVERPVIPGKHIVRVTMEGHIGVEREVTFVEGVEEKVNFDLDKMPSRLPSRAWGWASLGVGIATVGGGVAMTVLHDRPFNPDCDPNEGNQDPNGECRFLWNTKWAGVGLGIAGGALTTLGIAILIDKAKRKKKQKKSDEASANLDVGPTSIGVSGRF